mgnify:CR=1 FL=1
MRALNDGTTLPDIGFGTYPLRGDEGTAAVLDALAIGYRLIDTAVNYRNEDAVGRAIARTEVPRSEIVVTTKLPGRDHGFDETLRSFDRSAEALGLDVVDLYLIHWPNPSIGKYVDAKEVADTFRGCEVAVDRSEFPPAGDDEFYWVDLIGCLVATPDGVELGLVEGLDDHGAHPLLRVRDPQGRERLIPFVSTHVPEVDVPARRIVADWDPDF